MTTDTAPLLPPPVIPAEHLAPLLDDHERVCEVRRIDGRMCRSAADWAIAGNCTHCGTSVALVCEPCRPAVLDTWQTLFHYGGKVTPTWIEALR